MKFNLFGKKETPAICQDNEIIAPVSGTLANISTVSDPVFSGKMMGDGIAITVNEDKADIIAPANGVLSVLFPTGHAFGITMNNGIELLVHIGINTVESNGEGFRTLAKKQGDSIKAGEPVVQVDFKELHQKYDMPVMLIVTNANNHSVVFTSEEKVNAKDCISTIV